MNGFGPNQNVKFMRSNLAFSAAVELNIMWGKLKFTVLRKVHIFGIFQTILS